MPQKKTSFQARVCSESTSEVSRTRAFFEKREEDLEGDRLDLCHRYACRIEHEEHEPEDYQDDDDDDRQEHCNQCPDR